MVWLLVLYAGMSLVTFCAYAIDKSAARARRRRIPEGTLLLLGALGGWPGGIAGQQLLRHKTVKRSFRLRFWATVAINLAAVGLVILVGWRGSASGA